MAATTQDRATNRREGVFREYPVKASAVINAGSIVVIDATGYAVPASTAAGLKGPGRADEAVDNSSGGNGDKTVRVRVDGAYNYVDEADTTAMDRTHLGETVYLTDDQTVTLTSTGRSVAGTLFDFDADGPWIRFAQ